MAKWTLTAIVGLTLVLTASVTWVHFVLAFIATTCAALAAND